MLQAILWGGFAAASLYIGFALARPLQDRPRITGMAMGFGAGALLSAVAYELIPHTNLEKGLGLGIGGAFVLGALVYFAADYVVDRAGAKHRSRIRPAEGFDESGQSSGMAIFLGTLLDGVPESFILGISLATGGAISVAFVAAVFVSNVPEGIAGTQSLRRAGIPNGRVLAMWTGLVLASAATAGLGYWVANAVPVTGTYAQAFAAGAVLTMLADSMMPEAFEHGGKRVGLLTVLGYLVATTLSVAG